MAGYISGSRTASVEVCIVNFQQACTELVLNEPLRFGSSGSPLLSTGQFAFRMEIYPNGAEDRPDDIKCGLVRCDKNPGVVSVNVSIGTCIDGSDWFHWGKTREMHLWIGKGERWTLFPRSMVPEIRALTGEVFVRLHMSFGNQTLPTTVQDSLVEDLRQFGTDESADVSLVTATSTFKVHSWFIMRHSSVFHAMLNGSMKEASSKTIHLTDVDASAVNVVVKFMYRRTVSPNVFRDIRTLEGVLCVAQKYDMQGLLSFMTETLPMMTDKRQLAQFLLAAERSGARQLHCRLMNRISADENVLNVVQDQPEFDDLSRHTVAQLLGKFLNRKRKRHEEQEFPDDTNWQHLSLAQLQRACAERDLPDDGDKTALLAALGHT